MDSTCLVAVREFDGSHRLCGLSATDEFGDLQVCHIHRRKLEGAAFHLLRQRPMQLNLLSDLNWEDPVVRETAEHYLRVFDEERLARLKRDQGRTVRRMRRERTKVTEENSVIYYVRRAGHIKIGYTTNLKKRLVDLSRGGDKRPECVGLGPVELLLSHPGGPTAESQLHEKFSHLHVIGEWFQASTDLLTHIDKLKTRIDRRTTQVA